MMNLAVEPNDHMMTWLLNDGIDLAHMQLNFSLQIVLICRFASEKEASELNETFAKTLIKKEIVHEP